MASKNARSSFFVLDNMNFDNFVDVKGPVAIIAILESGIKRADGSPKQLMTDMHAHVVEIAGAQTRELKKQLTTIDHVISATQLGAQLRVLVKKDVQDPVEFIKQQSFCQDAWQVNSVRPSLEDVFVTCTGQGRQ